MVSFFFCSNEGIFWFIIDVMLCWGRRVWSGLMTWSWVGFVFITRCRLFLLVCLFGSLSELEHRGCPAFPQSFFLIVDSSLLVTRHDCFLLIMLGMDLLHKPHSSIFSKREKNEDLYGTAHELSVLCLYIFLMITAYDPRFLVSRGLVERPSWPWVSSLLTILYSLSCVLLDSSLLPIAF